MRKRKGSDNWSGLCESLDTFNRICRLSHAKDLNLTWSCTVRITNTFTLALVEYIGITDECTSHGLLNFLFSSLVAADTLSFEVVAVFFLQFLTTMGIAAQFSMRHQYP